MFLALREMRGAVALFAPHRRAVGLLVFLILFVQALTGALIGQFIGALKHQSADVLVYSAQAAQEPRGLRRCPGDRRRGCGRARRCGQRSVRRGPRVRAANKLRDATLIGYEPGKPGTPDHARAGPLPDRAVRGRGELT